MPIDPQLAAMFAGSENWPSVRSQSVPDLRAAVRAASIQIPGPAVSLAAVADRTIPGPAGKIPVRIYTPEG